MAWASRHPIIAWAVTGMGLHVADVFSSPRRGPLWVAIVVGLVAWERDMRVHQQVWVLEGRSTSRWAWSATGCAKVIAWPCSSTARPCSTTPRENPRAMPW